MLLSPKLPCTLPSYLFNKIMLYFLLLCLVLFVSFLRGMEEVKIPNNQLLSNFVGGGGGGRYHFKTLIYYLHG